MIEQLRTRIDEADRAVSPVIGVILMVAITVILAAVIGSFVLGIGGDLQQSPQVRLSVESVNDTAFRITHDGGDTLSDENLNLIVNNATGSSSEELTSTATVEGNLDLTTGDRVTVSGLSTDVNKIQVRIAHKPSDSLLVDTTVSLG